MTTTAQLAVLRPDSTEFSIEDVELPDPGPGQVLVRNHGAGICHSQLHEIRAERTRTYLMGHEGCGEVIAVGPDVSLVRPGQSVSVTWVPRPGESTPWRAGVTLPGGEYATTDEMVFTWGTHSLLDQRYVVPIPAAVATDAAAVLGCAVLTGASAVVRAAGVPSGASVVVWGAGGVGLSAMAAARRSGAGPIVAVDLSREKLELARRFGATHVVDVAEPDVLDTVLEVTTRAGRPAGADFVFDCVASEQTLGAALATVRRGELGGSRGGTLVVVGVAKPGVGIPARDLLIGQKTATASLGVPADTGVELPRLAQWCVDGDINLDALVTDRYPLRDINRGIADLAAGRVRGRAVLSFT
ncbi:zinc-binding dehydrogenase [Streptomyces rhizosphaericus]|uniref:Zinc-binding dehydrogenase n=1 Tax=Streptomyces rhizosphaericus TaxID=114699 RepID=A0A6G4AT94_9ACTN|nr:zinc-binding dehydrogenase [Streptomyces rhizosphaericus]NEW76482.1 zinc-binding dehydrogenase [Streptomyces rhizosphaericus]